MFAETKRPTEVEADLSERFQTLVKSRSFPCVGAKSALAKGRMSFLKAGDIRCPNDDRAIYARLVDFVAQYRKSPGAFQTLVVIFAAASRLSEEQFEQAMWTRLQALEALDVAEGYGYDARVSSDVADADFSLSFAEEAFFVVGLHPAASRRSRAFEMPVMVFNPHDQFVQLRAQGRYETLRASIIARDIDYSGSANPMIARHGDRSEARQYSGRQVSDDWQCPFKRVHGGA